MELRWKFWRAEPAAVFSTRDKIDWKWEIYILSKRDNNRKLLLRNHVFRKSGIMGEKRKFDPVNLGISNKYSTNYFERLDFAVVT